MFSKTILSFSIFLCFIFVSISALLGLGLPPPGAVLAGSPLGPRREKWEPWAHSRAGASGLSGNPQVQTLGTNRRQKMHAGPQPS